MPASIEITSFLTIDRELQGAYNIYRYIYNKDIEVITAPPIKTD